MPAKETAVQWTPFALSCLDEIYDYIAYKEKSNGPAFKLVSTIFEKVDQLKSFPVSGQSESLLQAIGQDSRYLIVASYKIIYEYHPINKTVIITDIFHISQQPGKITRTKK